MPISRCKTPPSYKRGIFIHTYKVEVPSRKHTSELSLCNLTIAKTSVGRFSKSKELVLTLN